MPTNIAAGYRELTALLKKQYKQHVTAATPGARYRQWVHALSKFGKMPGAWARANPSLATIARQSVADPRIKQQVLEALKKTGMVAPEKLISKLGTLVSPAEAVKVLAMGLGGYGVMPGPSPGILFSPSSAREVLRGIPALPNPRGGLPSFLAHELGELESLKVGARWRHTTERTKGHAPLGHLSRLPILAEYRAAAMTGHALGGEEGARAALKTTVRARLTATRLQVEALEKMGVPNIRESKLAQAEIETLSRRVLRVLNKTEKRKAGLSLTELMELRADPPGIRRIHKGPATYLPPNEPLRRSSVEPIVNPNDLLPVSPHTDPHTSELRNLRSAAHPPFSTGPTVRPSGRTAASEITEEATESFSKYFTRRNVTIGAGAGLLLAGIGFMLHRRSKHYDTAEQRNHQNQYWDPQAVAFSRANWGSRLTFSAA